MVVSRQRDKAANRVRAREDNVEDQHIRARRVAPSGSHKRRMTHQICISCSIQRRGAKVDRWAKDLADEPNGAIVNNVQTTIADLEGQDDKNMVVRINVTHHTYTETFVNM